VSERELSLKGRGYGLQMIRKIKERFVKSYRVNWLIGAAIRNRKVQLVWSDARQRVLLNAGCSGNIFEDFINLDCVYKPGVDLCWDLVKKVPLPDHCLQGVFIEHCIEHIPFEKVCTSVLPEFKRLLVPGGTLRISMPDCEELFDMYQRVKSGLPAWPNQPLSDRTPMIAINRLMRANGHLFGWDFQTVKLVLEDVGFVRVVKESYMHGRDPRLLVDSARRASESLYVEASTAIE
jgi:predicted SAM-dependent methyltransferase